MTEQEILAAVQDIFRDNFDDDTLEITRATCADDIEDWDSLEQINLLTAIEKKFNIKFKLSDVRGLKASVICWIWLHGWCNSHPVLQPTGEQCPPLQAGAHLKKIF